MKKVLFSYNDDNNYPMFWFDREYLGTDLMGIASDMFYLGMEETEPNTKIETLELYILDLPDEISEEEVEILDNYLNDGTSIDSDVWQEIINQNWIGAIALIKNK